MPIGTVGTLCEPFLHFPDSGNLKFRLSPQSCKILGSVPRRKILTFDFIVSCTPARRDSQKLSEVLISPTVMVVENLKYRLLKYHKNLAAKTKSQDGWTQEEEEMIDSTEELHTLFNTDFNKLYDTQSLELIVTNKMLSMAFQQLFWTCWFGQFPTLSDSILNGIRKLIAHPLENYVLQK